MAAAINCQGLRGPWMQPHDGCGAAQNVWLCGKVETTTAAIKISAP
jgi:hypothetical protein